MTCTFFVKVDQGWVFICFCIINAVIGNTHLLVTFAWKQHRRQWACSHSSQGWLIDWLNTCRAQMLMPLLHNDIKLNYSWAAISILLKAHGAWPMYWSVFRKCHILRWDWSVLIRPVFPLENFGACWFLCMFPQSCDLRTETERSL
jgi:hypothetical protein